MADNPRNTQDHDLLFIPRAPQDPTRPLQRIRVKKRTWTGNTPNVDPTEPTGGQVITVEPPSRDDDPGYRKALSIAQPSGATDRGPAFACMPIRPEPATSFYTCFLVNGNNVRFRNPWTESGWNDQPDSPDDVRTGQWGDASFEALIAGSQGRVYHLTVTNGRPAMAPVDLALEGEIWIQLRSGVVAGRAEYVNRPGGRKILPLINVTALSF
jgi:hypothetical protein